MNISNFDVRTESKLAEDYFHEAIHHCVFKCDVSDDVEQTR